MRLERSEGGKDGERRRCLSFFFFDPSLLLLLLLLLLSSFVSRGSGAAVPVSRSAPSVTER